MCPHTTTTCVLILLLYMRPRSTAMDVSSDTNNRFSFTFFSVFPYICVLILLLYMSSDTDNRQGALLGDTPLRRGAR